MSSDEEDAAGNRHPLNAVIAAAARRNLNNKSSGKASSTIASKPAAQDAQPAQQEQEAELRYMDGQVVQAGAVGEQLEGSQQQIKPNQAKKKSKRSSKSREPEGDAAPHAAAADTVLANVELADGQAPEAAAAAASGKELPRSVSAPPTTGHRAAMAAADGQQQADVVNPKAAPKLLSTKYLAFVEDKQEIVQAVELKHITRAPRYFDEDAGIETNTKRCFNCGQMGHLISNCKNATRLKPCHLCAQVDHEGRDCPNRLCFKCGRPGHLGKDCKQGRLEGWESAAACCNRCGSTSTCACVGKGDYFRYEGGCTSAYQVEDLKYCRCYVCGRQGHLCCKPTPRVPAFNLSCYFCGADGHLGEDCPLEDRPHLKAERAGDARRAQAERELERDRQFQTGREGRASYMSHDDRRAGYPPRSQSVRPQHHHWDDDDMLVPHRGQAGTHHYHDGRRQYDDSRQQYMSRTASAPRLHPYGQQMPQYGVQQQQQQYGMQQQYNQYGGQPQYNPPPQFHQQPQYNQSQYNQQGAHHAPYHVYDVYEQAAYGQHNGQQQQQQQYMQHHQQQYGGNERSRQATTQQQHAAREENERLHRQFGNATGQKRGRYDDDDDRDNDRYKPKDSRFKRR